MELEKLLTLRECAAVLGCRPRTLYAKAAAGEVPKVVLWRGLRKETLRFSARAINRWIESNTIPAGGDVES